MKSLLLLLVLAAGCRREVVDMRSILLVAKDGKNEVCFDIERPSDVAGRYCIRKQEGTP